ncbi:MAG: hypothetical protein WBK28_02970 [Minisyncoccia bacterium]
MVPSPERGNPEKQANQSEEIDPTTYSPLAPSSERPHQVGKVPLYKYPIVSWGDGTYVQLSSEKIEAAAVEQVVARMLKGILPVSDVVHDPHPRLDVYYSKKMPLSSIEKKTSPEEIAADIALFRFLFGDADHALHSDFTTHDGESRNIIYKNERVVYFDFEMARRGFFGSRDVQQILKTCSPSTRSHLEHKLALLTERFGGADGRRFLEAIIESTGKNIALLFLDKEANAGPVTFDRFYNTFLQKLHEMSDAMGQRVLAEKAA